MFGNSKRAWFVGSVFFHGLSNRCDIESIVFYSIQLACQQTATRPILTLHCLKHNFFKGMFTILHVT